MVFLDFSRIFRSKTMKIMNSVFSNVIPISNRPYLEMVDVFLDDFFEFGKRSVSSFQFRRN